MWCIMLRLKWESAGIYDVSKPKSLTFTHDVITSALDQPPTAVNSSLLSSSLAAEKGEMKEDDRETLPAFPILFVW